MSNSIPKDLTAFFSNLNFEPEACHYFAEKRLDDGRDLYFTARANSSQDLVALRRCIIALKQFEAHEGEYIRMICDALEEEADPYLDGDNAFNAFGHGLVLVAIDTEPLNSNLTFEDTCGVLGGHFVHAFLDLDWKLTGVSIEDI